MMQEPIERRDGETRIISQAADRAYICIRRDLLNGRWQAGAHLGEKELGQELGVSRTPIREALRLLASDGLVRLEPNVGASVLFVASGSTGRKYRLIMIWRTSSR